MQSLKKLHRTIKESKSLKQFMMLLENIPSQAYQIPPVQFSVHSTHQQICNQIEKLKLNDIQQAFKQLPAIPQITAIIIKASKDYTLAFLMIPEGKYFGWHDHIKMNGISRVVCGDLLVRSINPEHLQKFEGDDSGNTFLYPTDRIRKQYLRQNNQRISVIYPDSFNIHEIYGVRQSCFLDLLIPEYPQNSCHYYQSCDVPIIKGEIQDKLKIKKIEHSYEQIIGLEALAKVFKQKQLGKAKIVNNIIIK